MLKTLGPFWFYKYHNQILFERKLKEQNKKKENLTDKKL